MNIHDCLLDSEPRPVVRLKDYLQDPALWNKKVVVADQHFHAFCELAPAFGSEVSKKLQIAFNEQPLPAVAGKGFIIGVHVRRGDVRKGDTDTGHRFTTIGHTISILEQVIDVVCSAGRSSEIHLHTDGAIEEVGDFSRFPRITYHAGRPALETFTALAKSDILISTRSDFSMLAGVYCKGIVVCDPHHRTPLQEWIKAKPRCSDLRKSLSAQINSRASFNRERI
jgi:hypothetical protein